MGQKLSTKRTPKLVIFKKELPFYFMLIPGVAFTLIFSYLPMFGLTMAFQNFTPLRSFAKSPWVGLKNFRDMLALPTFWNVVGNTLTISLCKIVLRLLVPLILALLLNEVIHPKFMRVSQTVFFLPYFLSWAVMSGVLRSLFQYDGMVNDLLAKFGTTGIYIEHAASFGFLLNSLLRLFLRADDAMEKLNVLPPSIEPHATGHIIEQQQLVQQLTRPCCRPAAMVWRRSASA